MKSVSMTRAPLSPLVSRAQAYLDLTKPKIVFLLDFTALMAFLVATRGINVLSLVVVLVAGTLASGGLGR
jgi:heme O synthase-like polyprenyltransferase